MSTEKQTLFEQGKQFLEEEKTTEAISAFAKAINLEPDNSEYRACYAQALIRNNQYNEAINESSLAIQLDSQNVKGYKQHGVANYHLAKFYEAIYDFSQAIMIAKVESTLANSYIWRGFLYHKLEKHDLAIQDYSRAIEISPKDSEAYLNRGISYTDLENYKAAIHDYTTTLEIDKNNSDALFHRGFCYYNLKDYESAIRDFSQAFDLKPELGSALYWRAYSYYELNDYENYLLDKARHYDKGGEVDLLSKDGTSGDDYVLFLDTINKHLGETLLPLLKTRKETIVEIFPIWILLWGHHKQQRMVNGGSINQEVGTYGQGYVCLTTQNVHIISIGSLCNNVKKVVKNPLSFLLGMIEQFEYSKTDQFWSIPNSTIKGVQSKTDDSLKRDFILLRVDDASWELYPFFTWEKELQFTAFNMARTGKFNNIWPNAKASNPSSDKILELIRKLGDLKNQNLISDSEFESKKIELLSRL